MGQGAAAGMDRAGLEAIVNRYVAALLAHDPAIAPFAPGAVFAENDQRLALGQASWRTIESFGLYRHYFADPEQGEAGLIANLTENGAGCVYILRLKTEGGLISEAEQFVIRDANGFQFYEELGAPDPVWLEPIPPDQRQSREALQAASWMYFQALEVNDGAGIYPFRPDCGRLEHGRNTVGREDNEGYGHADSDTNFVTLPVKQQYELGMMAFVSVIRDRRALVVDIERGAVLGSSCFDFEGVLEHIVMTSGAEWKIPPYFRTPRTHQMNEAFKVIGGAYRYVEMTLLEVPYATRPAFLSARPASKLTYARTSPPPAPVAANRRADLLGLVARVCEAMVRCCPCDLPLADDVVFTENGQRVAPGMGSWKTITAMGDYQVMLADPATGQAGAYGAVAEHALFAMMALRIKVADGLISEIEAIIVRPEVFDEALGGSTFTMFVPPLAHDLDPKAFAALDPALLAAPPAAQSGEQMARALDAWFAAGGGARRENGAAVTDALVGEHSVLRGHRALVVDAATGLALDLALLDHPALQPAAPTYAAPSTDLHALLFRIEGEAVVQAEGIVRRLPYGADAGWQGATASRPAAAGRSSPR